MTSASTCRPSSRRSWLKLSCALLIFHPPCPYQEASAMSFPQQSRDGGRSQTLLQMCIALQVPIPNRQPLQQFHCSRKILLADTCAEQKFATLGLSTWQVMTSST